MTLVRVALRNLKDEREKLATDGPAEEEMTRITLAHFSRIN